LVRLGAAMLTRGSAHENQIPGASAMANACSALDTRLRSAVRRVRRIYGIRAIEHQLVLQRLARAAIALRAAHLAQLRATEDPRAETEALATLAVDTLVDEGDRWLDALGKTDVEE